MTPLEIHPAVDVNQTSSSEASAPQAECGYLFNCPRTGAWRGSVQVPGSSLSIRLPTLVVWLSFGLRGPGAAMGEERLKRGLPSSK